MKKIAEAQAQEENIKLLAAQRQMYSDAKRLQFYEVLLAVPITILITGLAMFIPAFEQFSIYWWGILLFPFVILFEKVCGPSLREKAAKVQEKFDCEVLNMEFQEIKMVPMPNSGEISVYADKHLRKQGNREKLNNWYSPIVD